MPVSKQRDYPLTRELLDQYRDAALTNAHALLDEATLLLQHAHHARAYFLAVASIEEVGKAVQAFEGMGRNLKDPAVSTRLKVQFGDHGVKISFAFLPWFLRLEGSSNPSEELFKILDLIVDIHHGREPAMYTDIYIDGPSVKTPSTLICPITAASCVRLARDVLALALPYVTQTAPEVKTRSQDTFFAMATAWSKMIKMKDFWEYYRSRRQAGDRALDTAAIQYHKVYLSKGLQFKPASPS